MLLILENPRLGRLCSCSLLWWHQEHLHAFGNGLMGALFTSAVVFCCFFLPGISNTHNTDVCRQGPPCLSGLKVYFPLGYSPPPSPLVFLQKSLQECGIAMKFTAQGVS